MEARMHVNRKTMRAARAISIVAMGIAVVGGSGVAQADPSRQDCLDANGQATDMIKSGKLVESKRPLETCLDPACSGPVRDDCTKMQQQADKDTPTIVFEAKDATGNDLSAVTVTIDGSPLLNQLDGHAVGVDPGSHKFAFMIDGQPTIERTLILNQGEKDRREVINVPKPPEVTPVPTAPTATTAPPVPIDTTPPPIVAQPPVQTVSAPPVDLSKPAPSTRGTSAFVYLGFTLAGAGIVAGAITGVLAFSSASNVSGACSGTTCPKSVDSDLQTGRSMATYSTVSFIVAGGGLVMGVMGLFMSGGKSSSGDAKREESPAHVSPWIGLGSAGLRGSF